MIAHIILSGRPFRLVNLIPASFGEKNREMKNYFAEEYLIKPRAADDPELADDVYIFVNNRVVPKGSGHQNELARLLERRA